MTQIDTAVLGHQNRGGFFLPLHLWMGVGMVYVCSPLWGRDGGGEYE